MTFMNKFKTGALLALLTALFLVVGQMLGGRAGLIIAFIFAAGMNFGTYWFSDKVVLSMYRARQVDEQSARGLYRIVQNVAMQAKLPMPKVYIIPQKTPNAFATGRDPEHGAVAFTEGILQLLNEEELRGVVAHEMSHIKNRDTLIATIAATIAGVISYLATMAQWAAIFGGFGRDEDGPGGIQVLIMAILAPIIATIIQLAISRSREYLADHSAAKIVGNPHGLADALEKLHHGAKQTPMRGSETGASLFIINPFKQGLANLFSTHPSTQDRVQRLRSLA